MLVTGRLVVLATPIGNLEDLSPRAARVLCEADLVLAEDTRRTGRLLAHVGSRAPQRSLHEHNEQQRVDGVLDDIRGGQTVVLATDAGTPAISDPGYRLVAACTAAGLRVEPVPGPSAALAALMVAGLPTDRFVFEGFLPRRGGTRRQRLEALAVEPRTVVLFVTPHRATEDLQDLCDHLGADRPATLARELTKLHEEVVAATLGELADRVRAGARGEITLVVGGQPSEPADVDDQDLLEQVRSRIADGESLRDAVAEVAARVGVSRRALYANAVEDRASTT
ncbi:MAG: 16S rRNA (cytidine(1402)-2'-O)-methyltransferase [Nitriliruptoraceae bacterium]